jgi:hypothetical protein
VNQRRESLSAKVRIARGRDLLTHPFGSTEGHRNALPILPPSGIENCLREESPRNGNFCGIGRILSADSRWSCHHLRKVALETRPKIITVGESLNLFPHPVRGMRSCPPNIRCVSRRGFNSWKSLATAIGRECSRQDEASGIHRLSRALD